MAGLRVDFTGCKYFDICVEWKPHSKGYNRAALPQANHGKARVRRNYVKT